MDGVVENRDKLVESTITLHFRDTIINESRQTFYP